MAKPGIFAPRSPEDATGLILTQPLSWITSGLAETFRATLLPLRPVTHEDGGVRMLVGHFARSNDHVELLKADPRAQILVLGPNGYISPSWMADRTQAPTWNYASAQFAAEIEFFETAAELAEHLHDLVGAMEQGRANAWAIEDMGARYEKLAPHIIGFRAHVTETRAKFKLGQDERADVYPDITAGLAREGQDALLDWMQSFNAER